MSGESGPFYYLFLLFTFIICLIICLFVINFVLHLINVLLIEFYSSPDVIESMDRSPIHIPLPSKERHDPVWIGTVAMQSVAKFAANAYRISGPCDHLSRLVPDTAQICGRITHEQVWDYLYQLKSTSHKVGSIFVIPSSIKTC